MSPDYYGLLTDYYEDLRPYVERDGIDLNEVITEVMLDDYYRHDGNLEA
jgi:multiple sugar transport system substrate-binding protein